MWLRHTHMQTRTQRCFIRRWKRKATDWNMRLWNQRKPNERKELARDIPNTIRDAKRRKIQCWFIFCSFPRCHFPSHSQLSLFAEHCLTWKHRNSIKVLIRTLKSYNGGWANIFNHYILVDWNRETIWKKRFGTIRYGMKKNERKITFFS